MNQNKHNVPLPLAIWLVIDEYDHSFNPYEISATTLIKSPRYIIGSMRKINPDLWEEGLRPVIGMEVATDVDIQEYASSRIGTAIHASVEEAITKHYSDALTRLGYPESVIERIKINPTKEELEPDSIPIYLEQRLKKEIEGFTVTGKFDCVINGELHDVKTTSTYSWTSGCNDEYYRLQGSIYRWLNPELITKDTVTINFIFTNWQDYQAKANLDYPQAKVLSKTYKLLSLEETEAMIKNKLKTLKKFWKHPLSAIPCCTEKELFNKAPIYKYYKTGYSADKRSTKNFTSLVEASRYKAKQGNIGAIVEHKGEPFMCPYCNEDEVKQLTETFYHKTLEIV